MIINRQKEIRQVEILDYEKEIGVELVVNERNSYAINNGLKRYYVSFKNSEILGFGTLTSLSGNANTIDDALEYYCNEISNKTLVLNAYTENRKEIQIPTLIHTKLLGE